MQLICRQQSTKDVITLLTDEVRKHNYLSLSGRVRIFYVLLKFQTLMDQNYSAIVTYISYKRQIPEKSNLRTGLRKFSLLLNRI